MFNVLWLFRFFQATANDRLTADIIIYSQYDSNDCDGLFSILYSSSGNKINSSLNCCSSVEISTCCKSVGRIFMGLEHGEKINPIKCDEHAHSETFFKSRGQILLSVNTSYLLYK